MTTHTFDYQPDSLGTGEDPWGRLWIVCGGCGERRLVWPEEDLAPHNADVCAGVRVS